MTIKKMMMAAGAVDEPEVIAPSSDWHYLGVMTAAGNTLGDHTVGGSVGAVQNQEALSSLHTFDGDFVIAFDLTKRSHLAFGVHAIDEDDTRANNDQCNMYSMTNSFWWGIDYSSGTQAKIGSGNNGGVTAPAEGSSMIMRRASGTITLEDDGSVIHTYGSTYSGVMRFAVANAASPYDARINNLFFTDTDAIQRDGFYNESVTTSSALGNYASGAIHVARRWKATRTGTLTSLSFFAKTASTPSNFHAELWTDDGTNPAAQVGGITNTLLINSSGKKTFTFSTEPAVTKGHSYWAVIEDEDHASTNANVALWEHPIADIQDSGSGYNDTVTSITASKSAVYAMEAVINATEEPTPDHQTLLLIQDEGSNGSQTFTDSSQLGLTCTANNQVHWDNGQNLGYGTTAIYVDGSDDHVGLADNKIWTFTGDFTIDLILRCTSSGSKRQIMEHRSSGAAGGMGWNLQIDTAAVLQFAIVTSAGQTSVTCGAISDNTNHHVCAVRSGNRFGLARDGTWGTIGTNGGTVNPQTSTVKIGSGVHSISDFIGWMKRIRITNDARWEPGVNFTPPTGNYPVG